MSLDIRWFERQSGSQWHLLMAAAAIPTAAMVILLQRHLIKGIALSGIAGR